MWRRTPRTGDRPSTAGRPATPAMRSVGGGASASRRYSAGPRRPRLDRPIPGIALIRAVEKERAVEKPRDLPSPGIAHHGLEPFGLRRLLGIAAAEEQCIVPDQAIVLDILDPPVRVEMSPPPPQPRVVDR